jgi:hypothetical protein
VIQIEQLEEMFTNMRSASEWDVDGPLLWGYFFTDPNPERLEPLAQELATQGYTVVDIYPTDSGSTHFLHVEMAEHHTPETLHERNQVFDELARKYQLESYDGMDVGPIAPSAEA